MHLEQTGKHPGGRPRLYPWCEVKINESFLVIGKPAAMIGRLSRRYRPRKFRCKTVVYQGVQSVRVWRIA